ncbi:Cullin family protein [Xylariaceae sp. FL1019]|nr:Cullin family protein [Xylariaceae sp. FL1019]
MAAVESRWNARKRRAVLSVFPTESFSQPTPSSTPSVRFADQGQPFGGPLVQQQTLKLRTPRKGTLPVGSPSHLHLTASPENPHADNQTRFDRAWHTVTARIVLPPSVSVEDSFGSLPGSQDADDGAFDQALLDVLHPSARLPLASHTEDIIAWHTQQVRQHFVNHVLPLLSICDGHSDQAQVVLGSIRTLEAAHRQYLYGLSLIMRVMEQKHASLALRKFRRDLHAIVGNSISNALMNALSSVLSDLMKGVFGIRHSQHVMSRGKRAEDESIETERTRQELLHLVESLCKVGLAGERFQILFAEILDGMMVTYVHESFTGVWGSNRDGAVQGRPHINYHQGSQPRCVAQLLDWVENHYSRLAAEVLNKLGGVQVAWTDVVKWKEIAIGRLAALRISEMFEIVVNWPESNGGIDDLRFAVTTPKRRMQLTDAFSAALQSRLLHSGRSTLEILRTYIAMIRTFHSLDHSRVLLDRVAYSLQLYLCTREDTVRIIVSGLLASPEEVKANNREATLIELVKLLHDPTQYRSERQDEEWDDMTWVPPPVDAGSNYKRRKSEDVIGTLISALGSPEVFIKEFQSIIGERLLSAKLTLDQEIEVLGLLKKRFGESSLQSCDVMIKDIQDSRRLDGVIARSALSVPKKLNQSWDIHAKILSRLYWPEVGEESFQLPSAVAKMQETYASIFEHLKPSRKLKWLNHLGQATVELEFEDRTIVEKVRTYEAAVINAFSEENKSSWMFEELWMQLQMDEDLLVAALEFWQKKHVIHKQIDDSYVVVERIADAAHLPSAPSAVYTPSSATAATTARSTPRKPRPGMSEKEKERRTIYWQFIVGMLTNSSPVMPLANISMMMKMLIPDGFPWSNEELQEFLGEKVAEGELELVGGKYKLVKK